MADNLPFYNARIAHIVVIGAGIAGLAACAAAAPHARTITLVEQDVLPEKAEARRRVPQSAHVHALLQSGRSALATLFPNLEQSALMAGSLNLAVRSQWRTHSGHDWMPPTDTGPMILSQSRPLLEQLLRQNILARPNVKLLCGRVLGFTASESGAIDAVQVSTQDKTTLLPADLIIDASGRSGRSLEWLSEIGVRPPPVEQSFPEVRYASGFFTRSVTSGPDLAGWLKLAQVPETRGAVLSPVEGGRWIATAIDRFSDAMPQTPDALRGFMQDLPDPHIAHLLENETPLSDVRGFRINAVRLRRFDAPNNNLPPEYLPIGDTIATFNPLYAQGMSVAALQALALSQSLERLPKSTNWQHALQKCYLPAAMEKADWAWLLGQAVDLGYAQFKGDRRPEAADLQTTLRQIFKASIARPHLCKRIDAVLHLLAPPTSLHAELTQA